MTNTMRHEAVAPATTALPPSHANPAGERPGQEHIMDLQAAAAAAVMNSEEADFEQMLQAWPTGDRPNTFPDPSGGGSGSSDGSAPFPVAGRGADCPPPMRLRRVTLDATLLRPEEQRHISGCPHCQSVQRGVRAAYILPDSDALLRYALGECGEAETRLFGAIYSESLTVRQTMGSPMFQSRLTLARREWDRTAAAAAATTTNASVPWQNIGGMGGGVRSQQVFPRPMRVRQHADTATARQQQLTFDDPQLNGSYYERNDTWLLHIEKRDRDATAAAEGTLVLLRAPDAAGESDWFQFAVYGQDWRGVSLAADASKALLAGRSLEVTEVGETILSEVAAESLWDGFLRQIAADEKRREAYVTAWHVWAQNILVGAASLPQSIVQTARRVLEHRTTEG